MPMIDQYYETLTNVVKEYIITEKVRRFLIIGLERLVYLPLSVNL